LVKKIQAVLLRLIEIHNFFYKSPVGIILQDIMSALRRLWGGEETPDIENQYCDYYMGKEVHMMKDKI